ncbi:unnamed protein product, partial [Ectocarpus sp. 13 AM-2016]
MDNCWGSSTVDCVVRTTSTMVLQVRVPLRVPLRLSSNSKTLTVTERKGRSNPRHSEMASLFLFSST